MQIDPELQKRVSRKAMQEKAQKTHTGEERWTNIDRHFIEVCSSACAIVGFFVGYSVALGRNNSDLCLSRRGDAEVTIAWGLIPPLCRPDNIYQKNMEIKKKRQKRESETTRGAEHDPCQVDPEENEPEEDEPEDDETIESEPDCSE